MFKPGETVLYSKRIHTSKWKLVKAEFIDYAVPNAETVRKFNKAHNQSFRKNELKPTPTAGYIKYEWEGETVTSLSKLDFIQKLTPPLLAALERKL